MDADILEKEENIKYAFNFFDVDKSGHICLGELKKIFKKIDEEGKIDDLFKGIDTGDDKEVL